MTTTTAVAYLRAQAHIPDVDEALARQRRTLEQLAEVRGWELVAVHEDRGSALANGRPGLDAALAALDAGDATVLATTKLDRLTRSRTFLIDLFDRAERGGWDIVTCHDLIDTTEPIGKAMVAMLNVFNELEA
jgi:DNA invertase Pin-like site-specific DNA recombinase